MSTEKTPAQLRAEAIWKRRPSTPYDRATERAWKGAKACVEATTEEDWKIVEAYYALANPYQVGARYVPLYRRKDFATHLNNWQGEIDRAREVNAEVKALRIMQTFPQSTGRAW